MKAEELRGLDLKGLKSKIQELQDELFWLRFKNKGGILENGAPIKIAKKDLARAHTILNEMNAQIEESSNG